MSGSYLFWAIVIAAVCTLAVRWLPFALFGKQRQVPAFVTGLGKLLPAAVMAALLVYCVRHVGTGQVSNWAGTVAAVLVTAGVHMWKKHVLLSILVGTAFYMLAIHVGFA